MSMEWEGGAFRDPFFSLAVPVLINEGKKSMNLLNLFVLFHVFSDTMNEMGFF